MLDITFIIISFKSNISTVTYIKATSIIPVNALHPKNEIISFNNSFFVFVLLSKTNILFVT